MSFLKKLFGVKDSPINSYADFWAWFEKNEKDFFAVVKAHRSARDIEKRFFDKLSLKLMELKDGFYYVTGMYDDNTVELILTADGFAKNIVFVEELVSSAPKIAGWKFTALKPALKVEDVQIEMHGYKFIRENISFYANELPAYPDEIDISIIYNGLTEENKSLIINGVYIFIDNFLGELDTLNNIDKITLVNQHEAEKELIPIEKLKDYLAWRQKEFIEKYEGVRYNTENDTYSLLDAKLENGKPLIALVNADLLNWDSKASHPWIAVLTIKYDGSKNNGMPNERDQQILLKIEEDIMLELKDHDGYLNIGRQTVDGEREIYFACKDYRKPSKVFFEIQKTYSESLEIDYDIYKDKYWQSFERFNNS